MSKILFLDLDLEGIANLYAEWCSEMDRDDCCTERTLADAVPALLARVRELEALVQHMKHTTYCAYCGFEVTIDSPDSSIVVAEHIRTCDKHPLGERVRWLEKELLDLDSRSTGYRVRAERGEARVRELEVKVLALQLVRDQLKNAEPIERAAAVRAERERCLAVVRWVRALYPETAFPPDSDSRDAISGTWARKVCDNIVAQIEEAE